MVADMPMIWMPLPAGDCSSLMRVSSRVSPRCGSATMCSSCRWMLLMLDPVVKERRPASTGREKAGLTSTTMQQSFCKRSFCTILLMVTFAFSIVQTATASPLHRRPASEPPAFCPTSPYDRHAVAAHVGKRSAAGIVAASVALDRAPERCEHFL